MIDILFRQGRAASAELPPMPGFFTDVNLDQVIDALTRDRDEYGLKPDFYTPLHSLEDIQFRHETMQDLERGPVFLGIKAFSGQLRWVRGQLRKLAELHHPLQKDRCFLEAARAYTEAVVELDRVLAGADLRSAALSKIRGHLAGYLQSGLFLGLRQTAQALLDQLGQVKFTLFIHQSGVTVQKYADELDYGQKVQGVFEKFKQREAKVYSVTFFERAQADSVESRILDLVAALYPESFAALGRFPTDHADFIDPTLGKFERDIQFYLAYLEFLAPMKKAGLAFCYPELSTSDKTLRSLEGFDLALAHKLTAQGLPTVCNDFRLEPGERVLVVTGPNQGGKTTFARSVAQWHYLASLGCPVPGREARLFLVDRIFTHFEKEEATTNLRGKLQDELYRIKEILGRASGDSLIVINEMFASTVWQDATSMAKTILDKILDLDAACVWVTFLEELAAWRGRTVSMVSVMAPGDHPGRTFKICRRPADGFAYALAIAEKHRLTYPQLKERI